MRLTQLLNQLIIEEISGDINVEVDGLAHNVECVTKNSMFFCIEGAKFDGHRLAGEAVNMGASVVVTNRKLGLDVTEVVVRNTRRAMSIMCQNFYNNCVNNLKIIGVVGTNGKTSTTYLLDSILRCANKKTGIIGTSGIRILDKHYTSFLTTPDPIDLHKAFYEMEKQGVEYVVMEVSAHAIALCKVEGISFEVGIFTNFSKEHLDFFYDESIYRAVKRSFFVDYDVKNAVINSDDELGLELIRKIKLPFVSYGKDNPSDAFAIDYYEFENGSGYIANIFDDILRIKSQLKGEYNMYNTLACAVCAKVLGIENSAITQGINNIQFIEGRNEEFYLGNGVKVVVDYAHTIEAFKKELKHIRQYTKGKLITVFGCGGDRDKQKRRYMGNVACEYSDMVILTEDNSRNEKIEDIIKDIEIGMINGYLVMHNREDAIKHAISLAKKDDTIAILGKGRERTIDRGYEKIEFSDVDFILSLINNKNYE